MPVYWQIFSQAELYTSIFFFFMLAYMEFPLSFSRLILTIIFVFAGKLPRMPPNYLELQYKL